jgi:hypothetical protein
MPVFDLSIEPEIFRLRLLLLDPYSTLSLAHGAKAAGANLQSHKLGTHKYPLLLDVRNPATRSVVLRMAHIISVIRLLAADLTLYRHRVSSLPQPFTKSGFSSIVITLMCVFFIAQRVILPHLLPLGKVFNILSLPAHAG